MGKLRFQCSVTLLLLSGLVGFVWCQGSLLCPIPDCRGTPCARGKPCNLPCQCTLPLFGARGAGPSTCTVCSKELCPCQASIMGASKQVCCTGLTCMLPKGLSVLGSRDGVCKNLAKGI